MTPRPAIRFRRPAIPVPAAAGWAAAALVLVAGCTASTPAQRSSSAGISRSPTGTVVVERPTPSPISASPGAGPATVGGDPTAGRGAAPTGTGWALPAVDGPPPAPRLAPLPADYTTPVTVAAAYFAAWCFVPAGQAATTGVEQATPWLTVDGWRDDRGRAVAAPPPADGVGTVCGPVQAEQVAAAPATGQVVWVRVRARQVWLRGGAVLGDHQVSQVRRVVRDGQGRWLVDVRVSAG